MFLFHWANVTDDRLPNLKCESIETRSQPLWHYIAIVMRQDYIQ